MTDEENRELARRELLPHFVDAARWQQMVRRQIKTVKDAMDWIEARESECANKNVTAVSDS